MIIDRYMVREVFLPFVVVCTVLITIFLTYSLTRLLMDADAGLLSVSDVAILTLLKGLISLEVLAPLAMFLGVMIGMGRLYSDSEIYAMRSSGISERRLLRPVMLLAVFLAILIGAMSIWVRPWAYQSSYELRALAESSSDVDRIKEGRFYSFGESGRTIFVESIDSAGENLEKVFIQTRDNDDLQVITSETGRMEYDAGPSRHRITLNNASIFKRVSDGPDFVAEIGRLSLWILIRDPQPPGYKTKSMPTDELMGSENFAEIAESQWRFSTPVSALLLALLAIPLSRSRPRQGRYAKMLMALVIYAVYFNLLDVSRTWVELGSSSSIWWVPGLMTVLVLIFFAPWYRMRRKRDLAPEHESA